MNKRKGSPAPGVAAGLLAPPGVAPPCPAAWRPCARGLPAGPSPGALARQVYGDGKFVYLVTEP